MPEQFPQETNNFWLDPQERIEMSKESSAGPNKFQRYPGPNGHNEPGPEHIREGKTQRDKTKGGKR